MVRLECCYGCKCYAVKTRDTGICSNADDVEVNWCSICDVFAVDEDMYPA